MKRAIPMGRFGAEGDLDGALLLLASKAGAYMTGATIVADGGQVVRDRADPSALRMRPLHSIRLM